MNHAIITLVSVNPGTHELEVEKRETTYSTLYTEEKELAKQWYYLIPLVN